MTTSNDTTSVPNGYKFCNYCNQIKPLELFISCIQYGKRYYPPCCKRCNSIRKGHIPLESPRIKFVDPDGYKYCRKCQELKPCSEFNRSSRSKDGLKSQCKACTAQGNAARYAKPDVRAKHLEKCRMWSQSPKGIASRKATQQKERLDPEKVARRKKLDRTRRDTPEGHAKRLVYMSRHRARKRSLPDNFTDTDWLQAKDYFSIGGVHCCAVCERPQGLWHTLAQDHWIPFTSPVCPGTVVENIVPLCHGLGGCNNSKSNRDYHEWLVEQHGECKARKIERRIEAYFEWVRTK